MEPWILLLSIDVIRPLGTRGRDSRVTYDISASVLKSYSFPMNRCSEVVRDKDLDLSAESGINPFPDKKMINKKKN